MLINSGKEDTRECKYGLSLIPGNRVVVSEITRRETNNDCTCYIFFVLQENDNNSEIGVNSARGRETQR